MQNRRNDVHQDKNVSFDEYGAVLHVNGKTGFRRVRIVASVPYLTKWVNEHPYREDPKSPLWICNGKNKMLCYTVVRRILNTLGKRAGIKKKMNPHNFRHSRCTHLANHLTEAQMKVYFGWTQSSDMASVYVHLSGRDVDNAILKVNGIKNNGENEEEDKFKARECPRCSKINAPTVSLCEACGLALDLKTAVEIDSKIKGISKMISKDIVEEMIEKKVREILKDKI